MVKYYRNIREEKRIKSQIFVFTKNVTHTEISGLSCISNMKGYYIRFGDRSLSIILSVAEMNTGRIKVLHPLFTG